MKAQELLKEFDRVILACGASNPRDIQVPGRDAGNIYFAVDFLKSVTKSLLDSNFKDNQFIPAKGNMYWSSAAATPETIVWEQPSVWAQNPLPS